MEDIILIGSGGHAKSIIEIIESKNEFRIKGLVIEKNSQNKEILCYEALGNDKDLKDLKNNFNYAFIAIGFIKNTQRKLSIAENLYSLNFKLPKLYSNFAIVSKYAEVGDGTSIGHGAIVNSSTKIGENCIINSKALVEHDVEIGNFSHISTGVIINGGTKIGDNCFIGSGAIIREGLQIPNGSVISAGKRVMGWPIIEN